MPLDIFFSLAAALSNFTYKVGTVCLIGSSTCYCYSDKIQTDKTTLETYFFFPIHIQHTREDVVRNGRRTILTETEMRNLENKSEK